MMTTTEKKKLNFFLIVLESFQFIQAVPSCGGVLTKKPEDIKEKAKLTATSLIVCRQRQTNYLKKKRSSRKALFFCRSLFRCYRAILISFL